MGENGPAPRRNGERFRKLLNFGKKLVSAVRRIRDSRRGSSSSSSSSSSSRRSGSSSASSSSSSSSSASYRQYRVQKGDTLGYIACRYLGNSKRYMGFTVSTATRSATPI